MGVYERQHKKEHIIQSAEKIFFSKGYDNAKMEAVAKEAGLSKGLVYFYFKSKEDLYMAITHKAFEMIIDLHQQSLKKSEGKTGLESVMTIMSDYMDFAREHVHYQEAILDYLSLVRSISRGTAKGKFIDHVKSSVYLSKIQEIQQIPADMVVNEIKKGKADNSIKNLQTTESIYLTLWAMLIGYSKLSITRKNELETLIFKVNIDDWKKYILKTARQILENP